MVAFFVGIWHALTATGRQLMLGATEAWGYWSASIALLIAILFVVQLLNGLFWRMIENRSHRHLLDEDLEKDLRGKVVELEAALYRAGIENAKLRADVERLAGLSLEKGNHDRAWVVRMKRAIVEARK